MSIELKNIVIIIGPKGKTLGPFNYTTEFPCFLFYLEGGEQSDSGDKRI